MLEPRGIQTDLVSKKVDQGPLAIEHPLNGSLSKLVWKLRDAGSLHRPGHSIFRSLEQLRINRYKRVTRGV